METPPPTLFLVDFENLPNVDLAPAVGSGARVKLFLGKHQTKLALELVQQIQRLGDRCEIIEVGRSGRNALDLTIACYLGREIERDRSLRFVIVSTDADFDPLIAHLTTNGVAVRRTSDLEDAPRAKVVRTGKTSAPFAAKPAPSPSPKTSKVDDRFGKLVESFRHDPKHCPKRLEKLRHVIFTHYNKKATEVQQNAIVRQLEKAGIIQVNGDVVTCLLPPPPNPAARVPREKPTTQSPT